MGVSMFMNECDKAKECSEMVTISLRISSWSFNMTRWRVVIGVFRHDGNAFFAADTAALNSSFVVKGNCETTSWVAYDQNILILEVCISQNHKQEIQLSSQRERERERDSTLNSV